MENDTIKTDIHWHYLLPNSTTEILETKTELYIVKGSTYFWSATYSYKYCSGVTIYGVFF